MREVAVLAPAMGSMPMQTPAQIEFEDVDVTARLRAAIDENLAQLEKRFGRMTAGRIVLKGPGDRHQTGGLYEIHIRLALPEGREVNVGKTPTADERYSDLTFALNDAFKRARRQLQDQAKRLQGQVKHHDDKP